MPPKPSEKITRVSSSEEENVCLVDARDVLKRHSEQTGKAERSRQNRGAVG